MTHKTTNIIFYSMVAIYLLTLVFFGITWHKDMEFKKASLNRFKIDSTRIVNLQNQNLDLAKEVLNYRALFFEAVKCKPITETKSYKNSLKNKQK